MFKPCCIFWVLRPSENYILRFFQNLSHALPQVSFYISYFLYLFQTLIALGCSSGGLKIRSFVECQCDKKKKKKKKRTSKYIWKKKKHFWFVPSGDTPRASGLHLMPHIHCRYPAHICFIHCHFVSLAISEEIRRLMHVELRYLILLCPPGLFVSCQGLSTFIPAPLCLQAHAARNWICQMAVPAG